MRVFFRTSGVALPVVVWVMAAAGQGGQPRDLSLTGSAFDRRVLECGTVPRRDLEGRVRPEAAGSGLSDGEALSFEQAPPILTPDYTGEIQLRRFLVVGDVATVQFRRTDPDNSDGQMETWQRQTTTSIGGRLVSIFEPSWPDSQLAALLQRYIVGFDFPELYLGSLIVPDSPTERSVWLRVGFSSISQSTVRRVSDRVQYASNVVNLVISDFEDTRVSSGLGEFNFAAATRFFYQSFPDDYDSIAFVPAATAVGNFSAFHFNVANTVSGLGMPTFDQSSQYGSSGRLRSIELFGGAHLLENATSTHEFAHQWSDTFNWAKIAGITLSGHQPTAHSPLWSAGETLLGAVLTGDRRVRSIAGGFEIERTPVPIRYHPIELYSMGLLRADQVPDLMVFQNQGQFSTTAVSHPEVGTAVQGDSRVVRIDDVIREHGARSGPAPGSWRRATVIVSRDALLSQREMDYWNFFAERIGDRNHTSVLSLEGFPSPYGATDGKVTLTTTINSSTGPSLPETLEIDNPAIGQKDFRGIELTGPMPTRYVAGQTVSIAGRVTATEAVDFTQVLIRFSKYGGADDEVVRFIGSVSPGRDFTVTVQFTITQRGRYTASAYLFWPNAGSQYPRTNLTPIVVQ